MVLRRRMTILVCTLVGAWVVLGVGALLTGVSVARALESLDDAGQEVDRRIVAQRRALTRVEETLVEAVQRGEAFPGSFADSARALHDAFADDPAFRLGPGTDVSPASAVHLLYESMAHLEASSPGASDAQRVGRVLATLPESRRTIALAWDDARGSIDARRAALHARFFRTGLVVAGAFVVLLVLSALLIERTLGRIVRPIEELAEASGGSSDDMRTIALRRADDEIVRLARAYEEMRLQVERSEQHTLEVLRQVATTLSHELINAIATIDIQLSLIERSSVGGASIATPLHEIRASLQKMVRTVDALSRMRSVVLTDYVAGVKMIDLTKSAEERAPSEASEQREQESIVVRASLEKKSRR